MPYVRKSFRKHFIDGMKWIADATVGTLNEIKAIDENTPIDDKIWYTYQNLKVYEYALQETEKELEQAVEGMYHNLNTL